VTVDLEKEHNMNYDAQRTLPWDCAMDCPLAKPDSKIAMREPQGKAHVMQICRITQTGRRRKQVCMLNLQC
jgi:hypothetical protein